MRIQSNLISFLQCFLHSLPIWNILSFNALVYNLKKIIKWSSSSPIITDIVNIMWTQLILYNVTCLYYACHVISISVSVSDVNLYAIKIYANAFFVSATFNGCYFWFHNGQILAINNVMWYENKSCPISIWFIFYLL